MRDNPHVSQAWPEFPNDELAGDLNTIYTAAEPPADLRASIHWALRERAADRKREPVTTRRFDPGRWMPRRFATLTISVIAVIVLIGASYASLPVLQEAFHINSGTDAIVANDLGQEVSISQTVQGFTMTVERVYADPNQIVIGYTLQGPAGRDFNHIMAWSVYDGTPAGRAVAPLLTDMQGHEIDGGFAPEGPGMQDGVAAGLLTFDGSSIDNSVQDINVRLHIGRLSAYERLGRDQYQEVVVDGPLEFDLIIPVEHGRVAILNQSVEAGGTTATLVRAVTAPTGTRVSLRGVGPNADVKLTVDGSTCDLNYSETGMYLTGEWTPDSQWEYVTSTSLEDTSGDWTLTVKPDDSDAWNTDLAATQPTGGPWEFTFVMP